MEKILEDVSKGYSKGLFWNIDDVSKEVGSQVWVPTPRWPLVQHDKVRAIDAGNMSQQSQSTEKKQLGQKKNHSGGPATDSRYGEVLGRHCLE